LPPERLHIALITKKRILRADEGRTQPLRFPSIEMLVVNSKQQSKTVQNGTAEFDKFRRVMQF
jgi:hypothetical protein